MFALLMKPTSNWFFAFSAVGFATLTVLCILMFNLTHKPRPAHRVFIRQEADARTMLDLYGADWYGPGCGRRRCR